MDHCLLVKGFPGGSVVKDPPARARGVDSIPESRRSPGAGNVTLENSTDIAAWWAPVHGVAKSQL